MVEKGIQLEFDAAKIRPLACSLRGKSGKDCDDDGDTGEVREIEDGEKWVHESGGLRV
jgi:hypothetical protein